MRNGKKVNRTIGRFNFTDSDNRQKQHDNNVWFCFVLRYREERIIMGFAKAKTFKNKLYLSIHEVANKPLFSVSSFIEYMKNKYYKRLK